MRLGTRPIMASLLRDTPSRYSMQARSHGRSDAQTTFAMTYKLSFRLPYGIRAWPGSLLVTRTSKKVVCVFQFHADASANCLAL
jgi:hypothetical protein